MQTFIKVFLLFLCLNQTVFAGKELLLSVLNLDQATKKIIKKNKSKVLGARTESINGIKVHIIKILTRDGRVQTFKVNANSGKIIK